MLNLGVIGCGAVAAGHMQAIKDSDKVNLAAIADISQTQLDNAQKYQPGATYTDYRKLLAQPGLDAVVITTHCHLHHEMTLAALDAGLHVLCEKPMAENADKCGQMVAAARKAGKLLAINFNTRSGPQYRKVKELIDTGELGEIRVVRMYLIWSCHQWQPPERLEQFMANGGPVIDSAVHFFEGVRLYTGQEYVRIDANGVILPPYENPQHVVASCKLSGGAVAMVEVGWLHTKHTKDMDGIHGITVVGDTGSIDYDNKTNEIRFWTRSGTQRFVSDDTGKHFEIVHQNFAKSIEAGQLIELASGHDGHMATQAAFQALASAKRA